MESSGSHWPIVLIEVVLIFGGVLLFGWWQLRSVERDRREARRRREAEAAADAAATANGNAGGEGERDSDGGGASPAPDTSRPPAR